MPYHTIPYHIPYTIPYLACPGVGRPGPVADGGEHHEAPPEAVHEGPLVLRVLLSEVDQTEMETKKIR